MTSGALQIRWGSVVIASLSVWVLSFVLVAGAIFVYAFSLGWAARGAPDSETIQRFADAVAPVWGARLGVVLTGMAALWVGQRVNAGPVWHGLLIGALVAGVPMALRQQGASHLLISFTITLLAGAVGGWLGSQTRSNPDGHGSR